MKKNLQKAIHQGIETSFVSLKREEIPVELLPEHQPLGYQSAIALKLSSYSGLTSLHLAKQLLEFLSLQENLFAFSLSVRSPGWLQFHYCDLGLAEQLQAFLLTPFVLTAPRAAMEYPVESSTLCNTTLFPKTDPHSPEVFTWQAAHARCCALLRLAQHQGLMSLDESTLKIVEPDRIPWLDDGKFQLVHPSEQTLIRSLLHIWDTLNDDRASPRLPSLTGKLSQDLLRFDRQCRIWGSTLKENRPLSLSRLALVAIARKTLKTLLEKGLNLIAPPEL
ncbi:DALR anticodon-binding domain-containing protein [Roseofilum reptotaenium CS-1145]|uniref:DALR anticodon binding domain-containing protein n=1 Tax=Roseofilum reptotaenium AO1-A TaxID=1925591 RepID=A0A1L9QM31_9CYAN|nr:MULTISPECIES: DALR anticodon-binding domain-containing protein [Roseofilum]MBP0030716.1 hypothetical protein [Roseofilum sp. Guam]MDB9519836.1 DALR anticodon-binding domain-containing protein [Roseofilum reptotaenium CS-1145]OJJ20737.1 hypothetical protein BI308_20305 [Roseofilum reptotaenium AO1-A]